MQHSFLTSCKAVVFDLDGVLVDSYDCWFRLVNDILTESGKQPLTPQEFHKTWGQGPEADRKEFLSDWTLQDLVALYDRRFPEYTKWAKPESGSKNCLIKLSSLQKKLGVASNSPTGVVRALLTAAGLNSIPQVVIGSDQVAEEKPAPDLLLKALQMLEMNRDDICYVGDSIFDEQAARAAGIFFVGYKRPGDISVQSFEEFAALL